MRPLIALLLAVPLLGTPPAASAEDFTGFYAGVNAGYAFDHDRTRTGTVTLPSGGTDGDDRGLPPSAETASRSMQQGRTGARATPAGR